MSAPRTKTAQDLPKGIRRRHARACPAAATDDLAVCRCRPAYQAQAGPRKGRRTATKPTLEAAKAWKRDTEKAFERGAMPSRDTPTIRQAGAQWLLDARAGVILARGDKPYRPSTLRAYSTAMEAELYPSAIGGVRLGELSRGQVNGFVKDLMRRGLAPQTVKNIVIPLRAIYRHALEDEVVTSNPTVGVKVPAGSGRRLRFATPDEIPMLLGALDPLDRPVWATAIYAGLRRGELMALRWPDVDVAAGIITINQAYDPGSGTMGPVKSDAGQDRRVPIVGALRDILLEHRHRAGPRPTGLVFARGALAGHCRAASADLPFADQTLGQRASKAWAAAGVRPITLHEGRHTFASLMIAAMAAAGVFNPKALQAMLGHASIQQTYDRYGHLFPGTEAESARMLDDFLGNATREPKAGDRVRAAAENLAVELAADSSLEAAAAARDAATMIRQWLDGVASLGSPLQAGGARPDDQVSVPRTSNGNDA